MKSYALVADIHGNRLALEAVLADIRSRKIATILNLGDIVYGPLDPAGTLRLLKDAQQEFEVHTIRGNQDRLFDHQGMSHDYTCGQLSEADISCLVRLPTTLTVDGMFLCHGSPAHDMTYLLERVTTQGVQLRAASDVAKLLGEQAAGTVLCAHTHIPRIVQVSKQCVVVNPGSVGVQAYSDDLPYPHAMQTGSPHARYAIVTGTTVEQICLEYDWEAAATQAARNGRPDWAYALRTGYASLHNLRDATENDLPSISALLEANKLARLSDEPIRFVVAEANGELVGAAGMELYGCYGLLRSVVVTADRRSLGLGKQLAEDRLRSAKANGIKSVFLLTDTAAEYWIRFGFERIPREEAPEEIRQSHEFAHACPSSATLMRLSVEA